MHGAPSSVWGPGPIISSSSRSSAGWPTQAARARHKSMSVFFMSESILQAKDYAFVFRLPAAYSAGTDHSLTVAAVSEDAFERLAGPCRRHVPVMLLAAAVIIHVGYGETPPRGNPQLNQPGHPVFFPFL